MKLLMNFNSPIDVDLHSEWLSRYPYAWMDEWPSRKEAYVMARECERKFSTNDSRLLRMVLFNVIRRIRARSQG
jgi:hypothetical protein